MKAVLTGGGTGGHIFPLVSIMRELKIESKDPIDFLYIGPDDNFSREAFKKEEIAVRNISAGKIRRYFNLSSVANNLADIFLKIPLGFFQAFSILLNYKPKFVVSKGGYGSVPVVATARLLNIPIFLHESDSIPGLANRLIAVFAKKIFISFPRTGNYFPEQKICLSGNPIRDSITKRTNLELKKVFDVGTAKPLLLVLGGSQGSVRLNNLIIDNRDYLLEKFEIIHQTGKIDYERIKKVKEGSNLSNCFHVYDFFDEEKMAIALSFADCVISRAGASSIAEIAAIGVPSILIPLPESAQNHQLQNALTYCEETKSCIVIEEKELSGEKLISSIDSILKMDKKLMGRLAASSRKKASSIIAEKILEEI